MKKSEHSGFTLMELLTVIAVISLLMAILMPALRGAREQGKRAACSSNMRQLTIAWLAYANDNTYQLVSAKTMKETDWVNDGDHTDPANSIGNTKEALETGALFSSSRMVKLYKCPSDKSDRVRSYSISYCMNGEKEQAVKTLPQIQMGGEKLLFIEEYDRQSTLLWSNVDWNVNSWKLDDKTKGWGDDIAAWHSNGINMSFADGHTGYRRWKDKRTVEYANMGGVKPDDNNDDLEYMQKLTRK